MDAPSWIFERDAENRESQSAHRAKLDYCQMGTRRSIRELHKAYEEQAEARKTDTTIEKPPTTSIQTLWRWSKEFDWVRKAHEWDLYNSKLALNEYQDRLKETRQRHAEAGKHLQSIGVLGLKDYLKTETAAGGKLIQKLTEKVGLTTLLRFVIEGTTLESEAVRDLVALVTGELYPTDDLRHRKLAAEVNQTEYQYHEMSGDSINPAETQERSEHYQWLLENPKELRRYWAMRRLYFAEKYHRNEQNKPLDLDTNPYVRPIYEDDAKIQIIRAAVQVWKTERLLVDAFACMELGLRITWVLPTNGLRNRFVANRVDSILDFVAEYKRMIAVGKANNRSLKIFKTGGRLFFGSSQSKTDAVEFPSDVLYVDELDQCNPEILPFFEDRTGYSLYQDRRYQANPSIPNVGIDAMYQESDQKEVHVRCPECGHEQVLDFIGNVIQWEVDKEGNQIGYHLIDAAWSPEQDRDIQTCCAECGKPVDRWSGYWKARNPSAKPSGWWIHSLLSDRVTIRQLWDEWREAQENESELARFHNSRRGKPYIAHGSSITEDLIMACVRSIKNGFSYDYRTPNTYEKMTRKRIETMPIEDLKKWVSMFSGLADEEGSLSEARLRELVLPDERITMGIDIGREGRTVHHVRISVKQAGKIRRALWIGTVRTLEEATELIRRYNVDTVVADAQPEYKSVTDWQKQCRADMTIKATIWVCFFNTYPNTPDILKIDHETKTLTVKRTYFCDAVLADITAKRNILPVNVKSLCNGKYIDEMKTPTRVYETTRSGDPIAMWISGDPKSDSEGKSPDHSFFADLYDIVAGQALGW